MYSVRIPASGIHHEERLCKVNIDQSNMGLGTLYITENEVIWSTEEQTGIRLQYRDIAIHATSTDLQAFPEECLYVMHNGNVLNSSSSDSSDDEESPISEVRFIPQDKSHLKDMFNAMSDCQCLHPDDEDSDQDYNPNQDEDNYADGAAGEGFYTGAEGIDHLTPQGQATMQRLEALLQNGAERGDNLESEMNVLYINGSEEPEEGQFEDA